MNLLYPESVFKSNSGYAPQRQSKGGWEMAERLNLYRWTVLIQIQDSSGQAQPLLGGA
jgi:hypothetical protein